MAGEDGTPTSTAQLRALVRSGPLTPGRSEAFIELVTREPRGLNRTLASLALDPDVDQAMRVKAVAALGRNASPSSLTGLRTAITADDPTVVQRAVERLGKVGVPDDLDRLRGVRTGDPVTQRTLRTAKCFLSYRHRLGAYRNDGPKQRLAATSAEAVEIETGPPTRAMTNRLELLEARVPGIRLSPRPARRLVCGGNELALMMNQELLDSGLATLADHQGLPAVLVRYNEETGGYDPAYYLMTDPVRGGKFRILGVRGSGRVALSGAGDVGATTVTFEVNATENPLEHPLTVLGTWDLDRDSVRFDAVIVEAQYSDRQQRRRKQPKPVERPER